MNIYYTSILFIGLSVVSPTEAISCYQCSSTSSESGCVRNTNGLSIERADYEKRNKSISKFPHLKDCNDYKDNRGIPKYSFCKIERVEFGGNVNAYIRDCSNGADFSKDLNLTRLQLNKYVFPNNLSTCGYSPRHYANVCVQICDTDFCNGPLAGQSALTYNKTLIGLMLVFMLYFYIFLN